MGNANVCPIESRDSALAAVAGVAGVIRTAAPKAVSERTLPVEVVDAFYATGLWSVFHPRAMGGGGLGKLLDWYDIVRAVAYEDSHAGWALFIGASTSVLVASHLPDAGREEVFGNGITPMAGVFMPGGRGRRVRGGVEVTGRWAFASGIRHAPWVMANVIIEAPETAPGGSPSTDSVCTVVVAHDDVTVIDDWHVAGLEGTGSMSFTIDALTIPERRTFPFFGEASIAEPMYQLPIFSLASPGYTAVAAGIAQRAIDEVVALLPTRAGPPTFRPASETPANQRTLGRAIALARGAHESSRAILARYDRRVGDGDDVNPLPMIDRAEIHQQAAWAAESFGAVTNDLFRLGGASGIYDGNILQRCWRDINVLLQHFHASPDVHDVIAKIHLGIPTAAPHI